MKKNDLLDKIKSKKGVVGVDVISAVIIFIMLVPTLMFAVYNVSSSRIVTKQQAEVMNILVNTLEAAKGTGIATLSKANIYSKIDANQDSDGIYEDMQLIENGAKAIIKTDIASYRLNVNIVDYAQTEDGIAESANTGVIKTVEAQVSYNEKGKEKTLSMSTVIK